MRKDIYGRTRLEWAGQWALWWGVVAIAVFFAYQLSRPLWDADRLIAEKRQTCQDNGMVMTEEHVKFGTNYYCKEKP